AAVGGERLAPFGVVDFEAGVHAAVDAAGQAAEDDALPLLAGEDVVVHVGGVGEVAVDGAVDLDALGLGQVVVRLLLHDLGELADDEGAGVADAVLVDDAGVVEAGRHVAADGDLELADRRRWRRRLLGVGGLGRFGRLDRLG